MKKQKDSTTSTTQSSSDFQLDKIKKTRKGAYTHFLKLKCFYSGIPKGYINLPRKKKKAWKSWAVKTFYYIKGRVYEFHPLLLHTKMPQIFLELFKTPPIPWSSGQTMRFRRYTELPNG